MIGWILPLFCAFSIAQSHDIAEEDGVLVLNKDNFKEALKIHQHILVDYYAPWCGHCKDLAPEYVKAAKILKDQKRKIKLAKVDATVETDLAEEAELQGYPTMIFYHKGKPSQFAVGSKTAQEIVKYLKDQTKAVVKVLKTTDDADDFKMEHKVAVIGLFKDPESENAKIFQKAAELLEDSDFPLATSTEKAVIESLKGKADKIYLFKQGAGGEIAEYAEKEFNAEDIAKWAVVNSMPIVADFSREVADKLFQGPIKSHNILFLRKSEESSAATIKEFETAAKKFIGKLHFILVDVNGPESKGILEFFNMNKEEAPTMRIINLENLQEEMPKYKPNFEDYTAENIAKFTQEYLDGKLKKDFLSDELPKDWDSKPVKVLVGKNFQKVVNDPDKIVVVEFYAPWCGHCKDLAPIWEFIGDKFKDSKKVVIAKIDGTHNEMEGVDIKGYPTIRLYPLGKNKKHVDFTGSRTQDGIVRFIEKHIKGEMDEKKEAKKEEKSEPEKTEKPKKEEKKADKPAAKKEEKVEKKKEEKKPKVEEKKVKKDEKPKKEKKSEKKEKKEEL